MYHQTQYFIWFESQMQSKLLPISFMKYCSTDQTSKNHRLWVMSCGSPLHLGVTGEPDKSPICILCSIFMNIILKGHKNIFGNQSCERLNIQMDSVRPCMKIETWPTICSDQPRKSNYYPHKGPRKPACFLCQTCRKSDYYLSWLILEPHQ